LSFLMALRFTAVSCLSSFFESLLLHPFLSFPFYVLWMPPSLHHCCSSLSDECTLIEFGLSSFAFRE
jgi:hypothetical protein